LIIEAEPQTPRESLNAIDCSRSPQTSSKVEATRCSEVSKAAGQVIDLGFCPRCKDVLQPEHTEGYASRLVDGVLFCTFCAGHVESDPAERKKWVDWAKTEASN
jgi:hypothetical protein